MWYNSWLYRAQERAVAQVLCRAGVEVSDKRVLDIGSGTGYWLDWYRRRGAGSLTALELSPTAVERLRIVFPGAQIVEGDITGPKVCLAQFDLVNAMNVLYHIAEPTLFQRALGNLSRLTAPGGWLLLSDWLGAYESSPAQHVRLRPLDMYEQRLHRLGFRICAVEPVYTLLNGGVSQAARWFNHPIRGVIHRSEDALAPLLYAADRLPGMGHRANMRLLVANKTPSKKELVA